MHVTNNILYLIWFHVLLGIWISFLMRCLQLSVDFVILSFRFFVCFFLLFGRLSFLYRTFKWYSSIWSESVLKVSGCLNLKGFIQLSMKKLQLFIYLFFSFQETLNLQLMFTFFLPLPRFNFIASCSNMTAHTSTRTINTF